MEKNINFYQIEKIIIILPDYEVIIIIGNHYYRKINQSTAKIAFFAVDTKMFRVPKYLQIFVHHNFCAGNSCFNIKLGFL